MYSGYKHCWYKVDVYFDVYHEYCIICHYMLYMTSTTLLNGRLGNQILRNLAVSFIAEKNDLKCNYASRNLIEELGIKLFSGKDVWSNTIVLTDDNYFDTLNSSSINCNLNPNRSYFQTKEVSNLIYDYLNSEIIKSNIIEKNPFKENYNANNDLFVHIRLGDIASYNPGLNYYLKAISRINFDKLYISTDQKEHVIIQKIIDKYPEATIVNYDEIRTFQFGSTCKNIILSHGSFSAIIGYLSFFSDISYPEYDALKMWFGDIFSINGWNVIIFEKE